MASSTNTTTTDVSGSCNCGAIKISIPQSSFPKACVVCHCLNCRASCGSLFSINLETALSAITVTGQTAIYNDKGDSGKAVYRHFCGTCGSPVMSLIEANPAIAFVKGGLFRSAGVDLPPPAVEIFGRNCENWERGAVEGINVVK